MIHLQVSKELAKLLKDRKRINSKNRRKLKIMALMQTRALRSLFRTRVSLMRMRFLMNITRKRSSPLTMKNLKIIKINRKIKRRLNNLSSVLMNRRLTLQKMIKLSRSKIVKLDQIKLKTIKMRLSHLWKRMMMTTNSRSKKKERIMMYSSKAKPLAPLKPTMMSITKSVIPNCT